MSARKFRLAFLTLLSLTPPFAAAETALVVCNPPLHRDATSGKCVPAATPKKLPPPRKSQKKPSCRKGQILLPNGGCANTSITKETSRAKAVTARSTIGKNKNPAPKPVGEQSDGWLGQTWKNGFAAVTNAGQSAVTAIEAWAEKNPKVAGVVSCATAGGATLVLTAGNVLAAAAVCAAAATAVTTMANGSLGKTARAVLHLAEQHPVITAIVAGTVSGGAVFVTTGNLPAAIITGVAVGVGVDLLLNHLKKSAVGAKPTTQPKKTHRGGKGHGKPPKPEVPTPPTTPKPPAPDEKANNCDKLKGEIAGAQAIINACNVFNQSPTLDQLKHTKGAQSGPAPATPAPTLVKPETGTPPPATNNKCTSETLTTAKKRIADLNQKLQDNNCNSKTPTTPAPSNSISVNPTTEAPPAVQCSSCPVAGQKPNKGSGIDLSKLPLKGMGLIGAYGGILGALLMGPIGMFVFGVIGIGLGYLLSQ